MGNMLQSLCNAGEFHPTLWYLWPLFSLFFCLSLDRHFHSLSTLDTPALAAAKPLEKNSILTSLVSLPPLTVSLDPDMLSTLIYNGAMGQNLFDMQNKN